MFIYLGSTILSTKSNVYIRMGKARTAINKLSIICKSDPFNKVKRELFQTVVSVLQYGCNTQTLTKRMERKN